MVISYAKNIRNASMLANVLLSTNNVQSQYKVNILIIKCQIVKTIRPLL